MKFAVVIYALYGAEVQRGLDLFAIHSKSDIRRADRLRSRSLHELFRANGYFFAVVIVTEKEYPNVTGIQTEETQIANGYFDEPARTIAV